MFWWRVLPWRGGGTGPGNEMGAGMGLIELGRWRRWAIRRKSGRYRGWTASHGVAVVWWVRKG